MLLHVLVEDIKDNLKLFNNTHKYFGQTLLCPQWMVAEF